MKLIIILLTFSLSLFASLADTQTYYNAGEYEKAIGEAKSSVSEYANPNLHLFWAKSAEKLGRDDEAMSAYERVEILDENNIDARVALVKLYKRTGRDALALSASKELQNYQLTPEQRTTLQNLRGTSTHSINAFATLGIGYDTNINIAPDELGSVVGAADSIVTMFSRLSASLSYINEFEIRVAGMDALMHNYITKQTLRVMLECMISFWLGQRVVLGMLKRCLVFIYLSPMIVFIILIQIFLHR